jgi:hypothetical protein
MYKDAYHPRVKQDLKKIDTPIHAEIKTAHLLQALCSFCLSPYAFILIYAK